MSQQKSSKLTVRAGVACCAAGCLLLLMNWWAPSDLNALDEIQGENFYANEHCTQFPMNPQCICEGGPRTGMFSCEYTGPTSYLWLCQDTSSGCTTSTVSCGHKTTCVPDCSLYLNCTLTSNNCNTNYTKCQ
jgi:hypothetical protein